MLGVLQAAAQVNQAQANPNNTMRFNPIFKHHKLQQKPEVITKVLAAMNSIKLNVNDPGNGSTKHFFTINREGARALVLRNKSDVRSLCDYRRAVGYMEDVSICVDNASFANWPEHGNNAIRLGATLGEAIFPSKFYDQIPNKAKADGFWA